MLGAAFKPKSGIHFLTRNIDGPLKKVLATSVSDPYSFDTDQHFRRNTDPDPDPIRIQGFDDQKLKKNVQLKK
jgi:hypothetical protein